MNTQEKLDLIYKDYEKTFKPHMGRSKFIPGTGSTTPVVVLVNTAPGVDEDKLGKPMAGPASQNLLSILDTVGINEEDVFFTNIVKFKTSHPDVYAMQSKLYLDRELDVLNPVFVGLCGLFPIRVFFPNVSSVRVVNGKLLRGRYVPLFQPTVSDRIPEKAYEVELGYRALSSLVDSLEEA